MHFLTNQNCIFGKSLCLGSNYRLLSTPVAAALTKHCQHVSRLLVSILLIWSAQELNPKPPVLKASAVSQSLGQPFSLLTNVSPPFYMKFCNGVDENFHYHFVVNIGCCITKACITNIIHVQKFSKQPWYFLWQIGVEFFHEHHCKASCKKVEFKDFFFLKETRTKLYWIGLAFRRKFIKYLTWCLLLLKVFW